MSDAVILTRGDDVWRLTLNREARRNALSPEIVEAAHAALDAVERARPRGLVLDGAGPVFCAGLDLAGLEALSDGDMLWRIVRIELLLQRIWALPCRTLGLASKAAIGAGADILAACQDRVLTPGGTMAFPGLGFGIFIGTGRLAVRIGAGPAERLLAAGRPVSAEEAHSLGLVTRIVAPDALEDHAADWSARVATLDPHVAVQLGRTVARADAAADMDALLRSAARPGLRDRIAAYADAQKRAPRLAPTKKEVHS